MTSHHSVKLDQMGLQIDYSNPPSVRSGPKSGPGPAKDTCKHKMSIFDMMAKKRRLEAELKGLSGVLDSHGVTMDTPLLTLDGFPRDDIDVAQIRVTRARAIHVQNDYKDALSQIEQALQEHHASASSSTAEGSRTAVGAVWSDETTSPPSPSETPFASVNEISRSSPAEQAGLKVGDRIRRFGHVNWINHEKLSKISEAVQQREGQPIVVKVLRKGSDGHPDSELELRLTPRRGWGGRGLLGCHILPA